MLRDSKLRGWLSNSNEESRATSSVLEVLSVPDFNTSDSMAGELAKVLMDGNHEAAYGNHKSCNAGSMTAAIKKLMKSPQYRNKTILTINMKRKGEDPSTLEKYSENFRPSSITSYFKKYDTKYVTKPSVKGKKGKMKPGGNFVYQYPKNTELENKNDKIETAEEKPSNSNNLVDLNALVTSAGINITNGSLQNFNLRVEGNLVTIQFEMAN